MREHLKHYIDQGTAPNIRGLRILLEYFYASEKFSPLKKAKVPVVAVFGSARATSESPPYRRGYEIGKLLYQAGYAVLTGASRGVMQAANQGAADAIAEELLSKNTRQTEDSIRTSNAYKRRLKKYSIGLRISLPVEEEWNPWVGSGATFHYFMLRKFFFATLSRAFIACEGGWGTRDELFEILTLVQTGKSPLMPIIYVSRDPKHLKQDMMHAVKEKYIGREDLHLISIVKRPAQAVKIIQDFYKFIDRIDYFRRDHIRLYFHHRPSHELKAVFEALWPKYGNAFESYRWKGMHLELSGFKGHSYGSLRRLIDKMNQSSP